MNIRRFLKMLVTAPNSSAGLIIRAETLEEAAEKTDGYDREGSIMYAKVLRELSAKNWSVAKNKEFIRKNLRQGD